MMVQSLNPVLPHRYSAGPLVHLGSGVDEYELRVYDNELDQRLVAAVEIVSPSNKDRPETRGNFVSKCEQLLRHGVCVVIVDIVTARNFNLYDELLELVGRHDPTWEGDPPGTCAAACRWIGRGGKRILETWSRPLTVGEPLPTLPLWLAENLAVPLALEESYEQACRLLRIP